MTSKDEKDKKKQTDREYLERLPYVAELLHRIDDINSVIRGGGMGVEEALNLITDLPASWSKEDLALSTDLKNITDAYLETDKALKSSYSNAMKPTDKIIIDGKVRAAGRTYARAIKQAVINCLDRKNLLFLTRFQVPESSFVDMHDDASDRDDD